jgi:hypothetical protein
MTTIRIVASMASLLYLISVSGQLFSNSRAEKEFPGLRVQGADYKQENRKRKRGVKEKSPVTAVTFNISTTYDGLALS